MKTPHLLLMLLAAALIGVASGVLVWWWTGRGPTGSSPAPLTTQRGDSTGKKPGQQPDNGPATTGTVIIKLQRSPAYPCDCRVYVNGYMIVSRAEAPIAAKVKDNDLGGVDVFGGDGVLLARLTGNNEVISADEIPSTVEEIAFPLKPAEYKIDILQRVQAYPRMGMKLEQAFPFTLTTVTLRVSAGQSQTLAIKAAIPFRVGSREELNWPIRNQLDADRLAEEIVTRKTIVQSDEVFLALRDLQDALKEKPPKYPVAPLSLTPGTFGGWREVDAAQVQLLVEWVADQHWGSFPTPRLDKVDALPQEEQQALKQRVDQLAAAIEKARAIVLDLHSISTQLEKAR